VRTEIVGLHVQAPVGAQQQPGSGADATLVMRQVFDADHPVRLRRRQIDHIG
jgi:hypothetical protein